jgi:hypothetical protein
MSNTNDKIKEALLSLGYSGGLNDMYLSYLKDQATSGGYNDAEFSLYQDILAIASPKALMDKKYQYGIDNAFTGGISDITNSVWAGGGIQTAPEYPFLESYTVGSASAVTNSYAFTAPSGVTTGDLLIAFYTSSYASAPATVSVGTGWTTCGSRGGGGLGITVFAKIATGSDGLTVLNAASGSGRNRGVMLRYSGVSLVTNKTFSAGVASAISNTSHTTTAVTPSPAQDKYTAMVFAAYIGAVSLTPSAGPSGFTLAAQAVPALSNEPGFSVWIKETTDSTTTPGNYTIASSTWNNLTGAFWV